MIVSHFSKCLQWRYPIRRFSERILKDKKFYEIEGKEHRRYFYVLDSRGLLFLEDSKFRNYATCLKDKTFLDFFFKQLRANTTQFYPEIPFVSLCGKEQNFLTVDDPVAAVVFGDLLKTNDEVEQRLSWGFSNLQQSFKPSALVSDHESGRLYHPVVGHKHLTDRLGLLNQTITDHLSTAITTISTADSVKSTILWKGKEYVIRNIKT